MCRIFIKAPSAHQLLLESYRHYSPGTLSKLRYLFCQCPERSPQTAANRIRAHCRVQVAPPSPESLSPEPRTSLQKSALGGRLRERYGSLFTTCLYSKLELSGHVGKRESTRYASNTRSTSCYLVFMCCSAAEVTFWIRKRETGEAARERERDQLSVY